MKNLSYSAATSSSTVPYISSRTDFLKPSKTRIWSPGHHQRGGVCRSIQPACACPALHRGGAGGDGGQHREEGGQRCQRPQRRRRRGRAHQARRTELHPSAKPAAGESNIWFSSKNKLFVCSGDSELATRPTVPGSSTASRRPRKDPGTKWSPL